MSDVYRYTRHGYVAVEYEDPDPPTQPRCRCGAMLSFQPTTQGTRQVKRPRWTIEYKPIPGTQGQYEYEDGFTVDTTEYAEEYVLDGYDIEDVLIIQWHCKRCGHDIDIDEM